MPLIVSKAPAPENLDPAGAVFGLIGAAVEPDDLGAPQRPGEADRENGAVAQAAQVHVERPEHGQELVGEDRGLLCGRTAVAAANPGKNGRYVAVPGVERLAELAVMPANPGETALERRDAGAISPMPEAVGAGGEVKSNCLRVGWRLGTGLGGAARKKSAANRLRRRVLLALAARA